MHPDKWENLKETLRKNFKVLTEETSPGEHENETIERLEVESPIGKVKLEWISKPKVLDVRATYAKRGKSVSDIKYIYSDKETVHTLKVYKWDEAKNDWQPFDVSEFLGT